MLSEIKKLKTGQARIEAAATRIEHNHGTMLKALIDARGVQQDVNDMPNREAQYLIMKVDTQDLLIRKHDRELDKLKKVINI
ncbi:hypothetical protein [Sporomusa sphaeroides]|uniref:hypothetical protein n=1 Tax=Sporomusa sphaeroides TaxID=47679 RepID=UPI002B99B983|nr:hypothetical protein [Sporomusa sphaeroides]HML34241.1 hypothetical protein [Sporomusa sphaeroides]